MLKRWIARIKNRRALWRVGAVWMHLFETIAADLLAWEPGDDPLHFTRGAIDALEVINDARQRIIAEYNEI